MFPGVSTERVVPWAGLRPMMPNMLPRVGAGQRARVFYNTGHGHLGWTLAAATAELVAEAVGRGLRGVTAPGVADLPRQTGERGGLTPPRSPRPAAGGAGGCRCQAP